LVNQIYHSLLVQKLTRTGVSVICKFEINESLVSRYNSLYQIISILQIDDSLGVEQEISIDYEDAVIEVLHASEEYFTRVVLSEAKYEPVRGSCWNQHDLCSFWAANDECNINPDWMTVNCATACQSCETLDVRVRCPIDSKTPDVLSPGDLDIFFERITHDENLVKYSPKIISRPRQITEDDTCRTKGDEDDQPWVLMFETCDY